MKPVPYFEDKMTVKFPAWDFDVKVILTGNVDASIHRRDPNHEDGSAHAACLKNAASNPNCLIVLPYMPGAGTIAHESWHAVRQMLDYCGANYENEVVAYHLGYLVNQITAFSLKFRKPKAGWPKRARPEPTRALDK
jgi:hypothetical protein